MRASELAPLASLSAKPWPSCAFSFTLSMVQAALVNQADSRLLSLPTPSEYCAKKPKATVSLALTENTARAVFKGSLFLVITPPSPATRLSTATVIAKRLAAYPADTDSPSSTPFLAEGSQFTAALKPDKLGA